MVDGQAPLISHPLYDTDSRNVQAFSSLTGQTGGLPFGIRPSKGYLRKCFALPMSAIPLFFHPGSTRSSGFRWTELSRRKRAWVGLRKHFPSLKAECAGLVVGLVALIAEKKPASCFRPASATPNVFICRSQEYECKRS